MKSKSLLLTVVSLALIVSLVLTSTTFAVTPFETRVNNAIEKGLQKLRDTQQGDGSWGSYFGTSGYNIAGASFGALCFMNQKDSSGNKKGYAGLSAGDKIIVDNALGYIVGHQQLDGSIYDSDQTYSTGIAMSTLAEAMSTGGPDYSIQLNNAINYFVGSQVDEGEGADPTNTYYGGWTYETPSYPEADDSNTQFALMGLRAADSALGGSVVPSTVWTKTIIFVHRCQNDPTINDQAWAANPSNPSYNDGGFVYVPDGWSLADVGRYGSTGSHTSVGVWNYILCGLTQADYPVKRGLDWLKNNFDYDENPKEHGFPFYYYYAWAFSKAMHLTAPASNLIGGMRDPAADGFPEEAHSWYYDFAWYLTETQHVDGSFYNNPNESGSWTPMEDTAFAILVLEGAVGIPMTDTVTTYTGATSGAVGETVTLSAVLTEKNTGNPIANEPIIFTLQGKTVSGVTGPDGKATATLTLDPPAGGYIVTATFAGDLPNRLNPSSDSKPFTVTGGAPPVGGFEAPMNTALQIAPWIALGLAMSFGTIVAAKLRRKR